MSQSHIIPLTDFAILLAQRGLTVTIITTPLNAVRYKPIIDRAQKLNLPIQQVPLRFPCHEAGLPEGCENIDSLTSLNLGKEFFLASSMLQQPLEKLVGELEPKPSCIVSTNGVPWTSEVARKFGIPRYVFHTISCFSLSCCKIISCTKVHERVNSDSESFLVPEVPHKIELTRSQLPELLRKESNMKELVDQIKEADLTTQGVLVNSFTELEPSYVEKYKEFGKNVWCIGPVSLCNNEMSDKFDRGNKASIDKHDCMDWLDSREPSSVIYACFGSLSRISTPQLIEIGLGLELSNRPFIWIIRAGNCSEEVEKWLEEEKFEERVKGRGLVIRGWAPQVLILSHSSVGGFLTHCGWNSTLEGVCAGVPMITWPMFAEQFLNEIFVVNVLKIGVRIGLDDKVVLVKSERVKKVIDNLMDEEGAEVRRKRARELGDMAKKAMEGGSSHLNISLLIEDVMQQVTRA